MSSNTNIKINQESATTQEQVVSFADQTPNWDYSVDTALDSAHTSIDTNDASLQNFFSRPIKIGSINWPVGSTFGTTINPWALFFNDPKVLNRLCNYQNLRATLKVRFMINGNGFHYGRGLVSYRPNHLYDSTQAWRMNLVPQDIIAASQRMHIWLDPTKSQGGTLTLPYVFWNNYLGVPNHEWDRMGELDIGSITTLQHANGGTDSVTISIFAWAEDVHLSIPTNEAPGYMSPQGGEWLPQADEYETADGPISKPATVVANAAGALSAIPQLKPMAMATQMAAGAVGSAARAFGFSRPTDISTAGKFIPTFSSNLANTDGSDTSCKLTFNAKQETTVSNSACGIGSDDEMTIASIASRESYLTQFPWSTSDVPEKVLWNCRVTPTLYDKFGDEIHYTPVGYVSRPFEQWRGSLKYRFQIVASAYHKGRLRVTFDPYFLDHGKMNYNGAYTHIIDLAHERDFTIEVGWSQMQSYADHQDDSFGVPFSPNSFTSAYNGIDNGTIGVSVVNDLTTPSSTLSDVSILVSVSAGDDYEVANPCGKFLRKLSFFAPRDAEVTTTSTQRVRTPSAALEVQSGSMEQADADFTTEEAKPTTDDVEQNFNVPVNKTDDANAIYFGDPVTSVRQMLKRYAFCRVYPSLQTTGTIGRLNFLEVPNFPANRGYAPDASDYAASPVDPTAYNYAHMIPLSWFAPLFCCMRGGVRVKYVVGAPGQDISKMSGMLSVMRVAENGGSYTGVLHTTKGTLDTTGGYSKNSLLGLDMAPPDSFNGTCFTPIQHNPVIEAEIPYHTNIRYTNPRNFSRYMGSGENNQRHLVTWPSGSAQYSTTVMQWWSVAEDFNLCFFQSCPIVYLQIDPLASVAN